MIINDHIVGGFTDKIKEAVEETSWGTPLSITLGSAMTTYTSNVYKGINKFVKSYKNNVASIRAKRALREDAARIDRGELELTNLEEVILEEVVEEPGILTDEQAFARIPEMSDAELTAHPLSDLSDFSNWATRPTLPSEPVDFARGEGGRGVDVVEEEVEKEIEKFAALMDDVAEALEKLGAKTLSQTAKQLRQRAAAEFRQRAAAEYEDIGLELREAAREKAEQKGVEPFEIESGKIIKEGESDFISDLEQEIKQELRQELEQELEQEYNSTFWEEVGSMFTDTWSTIFTSLGVSSLFGLEDFGSIMGRLSAMTLEDVGIFIVAGGTELVSALLGAMADALEVVSVVTIFTMDYDLISSMWDEDGNFKGYAEPTDIEKYFFYRKHPEAMPQVVRSFKLVVNDAIERASSTANDLGFKMDKDYYKKIWNKMSAEQQDNVEGVLGMAVDKHISHIVTETYLEGKLSGFRPASLVEKENEIGWSAKPQWDEAEQKRRDDLVKAHMAPPEYADPGLAYTEGLTPVDDKIHEYLIENEQQGLERIDALENKVSDVSYKKQMFDDGVLLENSTKAHTVAGMVNDTLYYPRVALEKHFQNHPINYSHSLHEKYGNVDGGVWTGNQYPRGPSVVYDGSRLHNFNQVSHAHAQELAQMQDSASQLSAAEQKII